MLAAFSEVREQFDFVTSTCGPIGKKPGRHPRSSLITADATAVR
jgi:hypothetical protein